MNFTEEFMKKFIQPKMEELNFQIGRGRIEDSILYSQLKNELEKEKLEDKKLILNYLIHVMEEFIPFLNLCYIQMEEDNK